MVDLAKELRRYLQDNGRNILLGLLSVSVFLIGWHLYSYYLSSTHSDIASYVPAPGVVAEAFMNWFDAPDPGTDVWVSVHIIASLKRIFLGFVLALAVAVPAGILMGSSRLADAFGRPIIEIFRPIPPLAWIPIFLVVFVSWGGVAIVFLGIFFPIFLNVQLGVRSVDPVLVDAARTLGANRRQIFLKVVLPFSIPYLMTGIKVGLGIGWMCIVAAEMLGGSTGVGSMIRISSDLSLFPYMYAAMVLIGILSVLTAGVAGLIERRLSKWMGMR